MKKQPPAIATALQFLEQYIKNCDKNTNRLPNLHQLAEMAQVSLVTVWKAVKILEAQGVLVVIHGQGIHLKLENLEVEKSTRYLPKAGTEKKWRIIRDRIHQDSINGMYTPGEILPSLKELCFRYDACFQTMKQALSVLCEEKLLIPSKRSYRIPTYTARKYDSTIIILARGELSGDVTSWTPWAKEFLRILENRSYQSKVHVISYIYTMYEDNLVFVNKDGKITREIPINESVLGFLVRSISDDNLHLEVLHYLTQYNRYVAVSDEGACSALPTPFSKNPKLQTFSVATGSEAGKQVARFLIELGHKQIAFFSPFHQARWSQGRLSALQEVFSTGTKSRQIFEFTLDNFSFPFGFRKKENINEDLMRKMLVSSLQNWPEDPVYQKSLLNKMKQFILQTAEDVQMRSFLNPLFEKALLEKNITAWVCANDRIAMHALDFLNENFRDEKRGKMPVIGFDDTFEAFNYDISSFNFNIPALVQAMLSFVLHPNSSQLHKHSSDPIQIEGIIIRRGTTKVVSR